MIHTILTVTLALQGKSHCWFARNLREDLTRRLGFYASDIKDGKLSVVSLL